MKKQFIVKIYTKDGGDHDHELITVFQAIGGIHFTQVINGGLGEIEITLPRPIEQGIVGELSDLQYDRIEVYASNSVTTSLVYSGFIQSIEASVGGGELTKIIGIGYAFYLQYHFYRSSDDVTITFSGSQVQTAVIDVVNSIASVAANVSIPITATSATVSTGNTVSINFSANTVLEAIEDLRELAGNNYYFYLDKDNLLNFKQKPSTATHSFLFGRDIVGEFRYKKSNEDVRTHLMFWNGDTLNRMYRNLNIFDPNDLNSIGGVWEKISDSRYTSTTEMDKLGTAYLKARESNNHQIQFTIVDSVRGGIEDITVGETCKIMNIQDNAIFDDNMQITQIDYYGDYADITVEDQRSITGKSLNQIRKQLDAVAYRDQAIPNFENVDITP